MMRTLGKLMTAHPATTTAVLRAILPIALTGCGAAPSDSSTTLVRDSAGITIIENGAATPLSIWQLDPTPTFEFGGGESGPGSDLFRVMAAHRLADGTVVIADAAGARIFLVGSEGEHLHTIDRRGSGPGDFQGVSWISAAADGGLVVYDAMLRRISYLSLTGEVGDQVRSRQTPGAGPVPPSFVGSFGDGTLLSKQMLLNDSVRSPDPSRPNSLLHRHDAEGEVLAELGIVPGNEMIVAQAISTSSVGSRSASPRQPDLPPFLRKTSIAVGAESYIVAPGDDFELREYSLDGELRRLIRMEYEPVPVPATELALTTRAVMGQPQEGATYPVHLKVILDEIGRIWVEGFRMSDDVPNTWIVFGPAGERLGTLTMPDHFQPLHFGADFILGVARDEMDVERVRVHEISID